MTRLSISELLQASPVRLAPMAGLTNVPFREIAVRCGSGYTTNEEIDAEALIRGKTGSYDLGHNDPALGVMAMQLIGNSAETLVPAALTLVDAGTKIVDINMGCPVPRAVRSGKGAALMRDVAATARILSALRHALPDTVLTIKIRGGWDEREPNAVAVATMAQDVGVDAITVHPRTRAQQFGGRAPWTVIRDVVEAVDIPVTGNGDVTSLAEADRMMAETGCAAVMIGRGALGRPWVFNADYAQMDAAARVDYEGVVIQEHLDRLIEYYPAREARVQMLRHLARYSVGWRDSRAWRVQLFGCASIEAILDLFQRRDARPVERRAPDAPVALADEPRAD